MLTRYVQRNLTWIDLVSPSANEVRSLVHEFGIDPLIAEELLVPSYKPKVERRGEHLYVILHFPVLRGLMSRPEQEVDFVIGKNFLITARYGSVDPLHVFSKAFEVNSVLGTQGGMTHGGHLFVAMAGQLYQALGHECDALHRRLQDIEDHIFKGDERKMVVEISHAARTIYDFRQSLIPQEEMLASLDPVGARMFGPEFSFYVRNVRGEYMRVKNLLDHLRESLVELRATNDSLLSTKQNEVMKTLTVLAFLFLPLSFMASLFGMSNIPGYATPPGFWLAAALMAILALGCIFFFKKKGWL